MQANVMMVAAVLLALSGLVFSFSVAVSNVLLGLTLALGLLSGLWWQGAQQCWNYYKLLTGIICSYLILLVVALLWSLDLEWGMHVISRHWFWLLLPVVVAITAETKWRVLFLRALSAGLALNLVYCTLQMYGYVVVTTDGSNAADATGHIGHIGFGFVYGLWAAWLLHVGLSWSGWQRYAAWGLAAWSYVMVFSAQGRSGYLVAVILMLCVALKWLFDTKNWRALLPMIAVFLVLLIVVIAGPGKERVQGTWLAFTQDHQGQSLDAMDSSDNAILATEARFRMWKASLEIWHQYPALGVGTGGVPAASAALPQSLQVAPYSGFAHPHNQYLLNLIRWGPAGLLLLLLLWGVWLREGMKVDWRYSLTAPLFALSGLALAVHGLSAASMEDHFSIILAVLLLGVAIAGGTDEGSEVAEP